MPPTKIDALTVREADELADRVTPRIWMQVSAQIKSLDGKIDNLAEKIDKKIDAMDDRVTKLGTDQAAIKARAGFWGALAAACAGIGGWIATLKMAGK